MQNNKLNISIVTIIAVIIIITYKAIEFMPALILIIKPNLASFNYTTKNVQLKYNTDYNNLDQDNKNCLFYT